MNTKYKMHFSYNNTNNPIIEYYDSKEEAYEAGRKYLMVCKRNGGIK